MMNEYREPVLLKSDEPFQVFSEYGEDRPAFVGYYSRPLGPRADQELSTTHYFAGDVISYHEHSEGVELFLVEAGRVECWIRGKRCVIGRGDMVALPPYTAHGFRYLEDHTLWREVFQQLRMNERIQAQNRIRSRCAGTGRDRALIRDMLRREGTEFYRYQPKLTDVSPEQIPQLRLYDEALARFDYPGLSLLLKMDRAETCGNTEIWQYRLSRDREVSWPEQNPHPLLFLVFSGAVRLELEDGTVCDAAEGDALRIPTYCAGRLRASKDSVLVDCGCRGKLLRAMEELTARDILPDPDSGEAILTGHDCFLRFQTH